MLEVVVELCAGPGPVEGLAGGVVPVLECVDACGEVVQLFTMDGSPEDGRVQKINCRRCLGVMQRNGFTVAHEG